MFHTSSPFTDRLFNRPRFLESAGHTGVVFRTHYGGGEVIISRRLLRLYEMDAVGTSTMLRFTVNANKMTCLN